MSALVNAPPVPWRMRHLPLEPATRLAVPWFALVDWNGKPYFSRNDSSKRPFALKHRLCWTCGKPLSAYKTFVLCAAETINRTTTDLPSHVECNEYALRACPFLINPRRGRSDAGVLEQMRGYVSPLPANPGVFALWVTRSFESAATSRDFRIVRVGDPVRVTWWTRGEPATDAEVEAAMAVARPHVRSDAEAGA